MNLAADDFELFDLPPRFELDAQALALRWKQLQREVHPDRHVAQGAAAQRAAMQWSVRVNEAYRRLRDPLQRAAYLCALRGAPIDAADGRALPAQLLEQQMAWHEALDDVRSPQALAALQAEVDQARRAAYDRVHELLDVVPDAAAAGEQVRALMFIERLASDLAARAAPAPAA